MPYSWEGNHRSGITLAMHHGLTGLSTYMLKASVWEMNYTPLRSMASYYKKNEGHLYLF